MTRDGYDRLVTNRHAVTLGIVAVTLLACTKQEGGGPGPSATAASAGVSMPQLVPNANAATTPPATKAGSVSAGAGATAGDRQPPFAPFVRTIGRFAVDESGMRFAWSASAIVVRFQGTTLRMRLRDEGKHTFNAFQVVVDGDPKNVLKMQKDREVYDVASGLPAGVHEVAIHKRTEADVGEMVLSGVETDGKLLPPSPAPERRMEIIGDSISTGYGNEGPGPSCTFDPRQENEFMTYGALTARALGADHTTIAWSGKTLYQMRENFDRTLPAREGSRWDTSRWQPQLVVVNLGTNNFANIDPGEKKFVELYVALVAKVRAAYPSAFIVAALGPMLTDRYPEGRQSLTKARKYTKVAVAKIKDAGDANIEMLELPEQKHTDGLGCGFHPSLKTHKLMADKLTAFARGRLGW